MLAFPVGFPGTLKKGTPRCIVVFFQPRTYLPRGVQARQLCQIASQHGFGWTTLTNCSNLWGGAFVKATHQHIMLLKPEGGGIQEEGMPNFSHQAQSISRYGLWRYYFFIDHQKRLGMQYMPLKWYKTLPPTPDPGDALGQVAKAFSRVPLGLCLEAATSRFFFALRLGMARPEAAPRDPSKVQFGRVRLVSIALFDGSSRLLLGAFPVQPPFSSGSLDLDPELWDALRRGARGARA